MLITTTRPYKLPTYTVGKMSIDGVYFCDTLEDKDRGLSDKMTVDEIKRIKVYGETAIPTGKYEINLNFYSGKFDKYPFYHNLSGGKMPLLLKVKGFEGILIHVGEGYNGHKLTYGCILVGKNLIKGGLLKGKETYAELYRRMKEASDRGEKIYIEIK